VRRVFIIVPSFQSTGPVKGAVALANGMVHERPVTLVALKGAAGRDPWLDPRVEAHSLADYRRGVARVRAYRALLAAAGGRERVASISFCLSADVTNVFCRHDAITCASVRGNLVANYRMDYGWRGVPVATGHLVGLRGFDHVVAMTDAMAKQVRRYSRRAPAVIGNFVDEGPLEPYRRPDGNTGPHRFVFVGSLTRRKQPSLLLRAIQALLAEGADVALDLVGDGPLRGELENLVSSQSLGSTVRFHGHLADPYPVVAAADVMVLPSLSEGLSRAALEALYLGVPCVLRGVDGNRELIEHGRNGALFQREDDLARCMLDLARWSRERTSRGSLLPEAYRQETGARRYLRLVESTG